MGIETTGLNNKALVWLVSGFGNYGEPVLAQSTPTEINCRWTWNESKAGDNQDNTVHIDATVVVDREIPIGSWMWLGDLDSIPGTGTSPLPTTDMMKVMSKSSTSDVKCRKVRREVTLQRLNGAVTN